MKVYFLFKLKQSFLTNEAHYTLLIFEKKAPAVAPLERGTGNDERMKEEHSWYKRIKNKLGFSLFFFELHVLSSEALSGSL